MRAGEKIKLTKRHIRQWVKALRSGKYKQGQGQLCADLGKDDYTEDMHFCCLGVACDLFLEADWERTGDDNGTAVRLVLGRSRFASGMPPSELKDAIDQALGFGADADLPSADCEKVFYGKGPCNGLAQMNDEGGTFKQIAKAIEKAARL